MKVVQINATYMAGSTGIICHEISEKLNKNGDTGIAVYAQGKKFNESDIVCNGKYGIMLHGLLARITGLQGYYSHIHTVLLINKLKKIKPDVVHLHNLHSNFIHLGILMNYLAENEIKTVVTLHDCWFFTGKCTHYTTDKCYRWQKSCGNCPKLKKDIPSWFFDRTEKCLKDKKAYFSRLNNLTVICVSDWLKKQAQESFFGNCAEIKRIYNWTDTEIFKPMNVDKAKFGIDKNKFIILGVSAYWTSNPEKLGDFMKLSKMADEKMQIVLVGRMPENVVLPENILSIAYTNSIKELAEIYNCADVYFHASREDTFGKVIAESLACGTPAVVYDSTACGEVIDEYCGYKAYVGDVNEVYRYILEIRENEKQSYSKSCIDRVQTAFDKDKLIDEIIDIYSS